jgi:spore coat protein U-like protein
MGTATLADAFALPAGQVTRQYPVYARIFGRQNVRVGTYTDSLVVTLTF